MQDLIEDMLRRFYTITATCPESKVGKVGPVLKEAVASLSLDRMA